MSDKPTDKQNSLPDQIIASFDALNTQVDRDSDVKEESMDPIEKQKSDLIKQYKAMHLAMSTLKSQTDSIIGSINS
jgi:hypothetical protein